MKKNVLVVDDDDFIRDMIKQLLEETNIFSVFTALNGEDAINIIKQKTLDLIITDYEMPIMNGHELFKQCEILKPEIPFMFITGNIFIKELFREKEEKRIIGFVSKPFNVIEVLKMIKTSLTFK